MVLGKLDLAAKRLQHLPSAVAVLYVSWRDDQYPQEPKRIDHDVPLPADYLFFSPVVASRPALLCCLNALAVDDGRRRF
jgi:hypothetical protein